MINGGGFQVSRIPVVIRSFALLVLLLATGSATAHPESDTSSGRVKRRIPDSLRRRRTAHEQQIEDRHLRVSRLPADGLEEDDINYLMDNFFMAHVGTMVRPYSRYWQLYQQRGFGVDSTGRAAKRYSKQDIIEGLHPH